MNEQSTLIHHQEVALMAKKTGAANNRGNSKQDYATPGDFRAAVVRRYDFPSLDLAASDQNRFGKFCITEETDSLTAAWHLYLGILWLNPPFGDIAPWAMKCAKEAAKGAKILLLTPASVDSNWWANYVHGKAWVDFVSPRISFDGKNPFPKPCSLAAFGICGVGYGTWRWKP